MPFGLSNEQELHRLEDGSIITQVSYCGWTVDIVADPKKDGKLRICGDYKVTTNPSLEIEKHPLPRPVGLFATLSSGTIFSKIDQAYQRLPNKKIGGVCFDKVFNSGQLEALPLTAKQLASVDCILSKII